MYIRPTISIATIKDSSEMIWANVVTTDNLVTCVDMPSVRMIVGSWSSLGVKLYDIIKKKKSDERISTHLGDTFECL